MADFAKILEDIGALWRWDTQHAGANGPHAILTSGAHSDGFINISELGTHPSVLSAACEDLAQILKNRFDLDPFNLDWVVGSAMGGIVVAHEMAKELNARCAFTEKTPNGDMELSRFSIPSGSNILIPEDVSTTGGTSIKTAAVLKALGCNVVPIIATLVSRIEEDEIIGPDNTIFRIAYLTKLIFKKWEVQKGEECKLCKLGSEALKPKAHWDKFAAR